MSGYDEHEDWDGLDPEGPSAEDLARAEADEAAATVACPYCREQVYEDAEWCPHCGRWIERWRSRSWAARHPFMAVVGVLVLLSFVMWAIFHV
jgi:hypothetical protein